MLRLSFGALLALMLLSGVSLAAGKGKEKTYHGTIRKLDAKEGTLTVAVYSKKTGAQEMEFKLSAQSDVLVHSGTESSLLHGKEAFQHAAFKPGAAVTVVTDKKDTANVKEVRLSASKKKKKAPPA